MPNLSALIMRKDSPFKIDRNAFSVTSLDEQEEDEKRYWHSKTPQERLAAAELMRQINYGYDPVNDRIQPLFEVVKRTPR